MRNRYPGACIQCRKHVDSGEGYFERRSGRFVVRCMACVVANKQAKGKSLSEAQNEYILSRS